MTLKYRYRNILIALLAVFLLGAPGCSDKDAPAQSSARVVTSTDDLIGGNRALGQVGDFLIENDQIRAIVQGPGFSRGSGVYGGQLLDVDLRRASESEEAGRGTGHDSFGELFPAFFIQSIAVDEVEVLSDGSDGGPAQIVARGFGGDFFTMLGVLNRAALGSHDDYLDGTSDPQLRYETIYELEPGASHLTIRFRVTNISSRDLEFPGTDAQALLGLVLPGLDFDGFTLPVGDIALFGATSPAFAPGAGYGIRFALREAYKKNIELPAFPGLVVDWLATNGEGVSYGLFIEESDNNFVYNKLETYDDGVTPISRSSLLVFLEASGFFGVFEFDGPPTLATGETWEAVKYLAVGSGDVGSVLDVIHDVRDVRTGLVGGEVTDRLTGEACMDCDILIYQRLADGEHRIFSQYEPREGGRFVGTLEPGDYSARVTGSGREISDFVDFEVRRGRTTGLELAANGQGRILVTIVDGDGRRLPARASAVGTYAAEFAGESTMDFLFDVNAGESFLFSDMVPDTDDPSTRRYIEAKGPTDNGFVELHVRPGTYQVYSSRGPEYDLQVSEVSVAEGQAVSVMARLTRVVDTTGWIAGDMHVHTIGSVDAEVPIDDVVRALAGEGIEWAVSTDHNNITNFAPNILNTGLSDWMVSTVGLELTTLDGGHFNAYPMTYEPGPTTHGAFEWSFLSPQTIFNRLREGAALGPDNLIIQVNHPRDTVLGYFTQYLRDPLTGDFQEPSFFGQFATQAGPAFYDEDGNTTFSLDFDALEVFNGSRTDLLHHYRVPDVLPEGEIPDNVPAAGTILVDDDGEVLYPGGVDDWYNFLNLGERMVAVGTSDTHHDSDPDGYARSMIHVGVDDPRAVREIDLVNAIRDGRVVATNGPLLDYYINDADSGRMGATIEDSDGTVSMTVSLTAAPWISVGRINIVRNGLIAHVIDVDDDRDLTANPLVETVELELERDDEGNIRDSWFVVESFGYKNMFPVIWPYEVPPIIITDAIGSLAEPLGLGSSVYGALRPAFAFPVSSYALGNPIWVDAGGSEFTPPGPIPRRLRNADSEDPGYNGNPFGYAMTAGPQDPLRVRDVAVAPRLQDPPTHIFARDPGNPYDVRRIFATFGHR